MNMDMKVFYLWSPSANAFRFVIPSDKPLAVTLFQTSLEQRPKCLLEANLRSIMVHYAVVLSLQRKMTPGRL